MWCGRSGPHSEKEETNEHDGATQDLTTYVNN